VSSLEVSGVSGRWVNDEEDHHLSGDLVGQPIDRSTYGLADRQRILQPLLPKGKRPGRPLKWSRQLVDGIGRRTRVGAPWRDVPERYGHWQSIYGQFRRRQ
jgi:hypothetical protein